MPNAEKDIAMPKPKKARVKQTKFQLPARLDYGVFDTLHAEIATRQGSHLKLAAHKVEYLGAAIAELLLAAKRSWQNDDNQLEIIDPSDAFVGGLKVLGLSTTDFLKEELQ